MNLLVAVLFLLQDPVPGLVAKIDGKDPEACFRAIAELADLGPARRAEIEKAAEKLPDFYRQALLAELRETAPVKRATLVGTARTGPSYLEDLGRMVGYEYWDSKFKDENDGPAETFDLSLKDVPVLEGVKRICVEGKCFPTSVAWGYVPERYAWGFTGRRALVVRHYADIVHAIPIGGTVSWRARVHFSVIAEPGVRIVSADEVRLIEAVAKGGRVLRTHPGDKDSAVSWHEGWTRGFAEEWSTWSGLELDVPRDIEAIERLRIAVMAQVATAVCVLEVPVNPAGKREAVTKDGFVAALLDDPALFKPGSDLRIRISSSRHSREELLKLPIKLEFVGESKTAIDLDSLRPGEGRAVDYVIRLNMEFPQKAFKVRITVPTAIEVKPIYAEFRNIELR